VHEKRNAEFLFYSQYTCQIYFAFLKKFYLYSFFKSVAFLSIIPKANILKKRVIDLLQKFKAAQNPHSARLQAIDNWEHLCNTYGEQKVKILLMKCS
jgi:hypothetical protein